MTEFDGYRKDPRRNLIGSKRCTGYVRVVSPRVRTDWNPVKLIEVLKSASIDIVEQVMELPRAFEAGIRGDDPGSTPAAVLAWIACLTGFGMRLNEIYGSPA